MRFQLRNYFQRLSFRSDLIILNFLESNLLWCNIEGWNSRFWVWIWLHMDFCSFLRWKGYWLWQWILNWTLVLDSILINHLTFDQQLSLESFLILFSVIENTCRFFRDAFVCSVLNCSSWLVNIIAIWHFFLIDHLVCIRIQNCFINVSTHSVRRSSHHKWCLLFSSSINKVFVSEMCILLRLNLSTIIFFCLFIFIDTSTWA